MTGKERKGFFQYTPHFPPAELLFLHFGQECHKGPKNLHNLEFVHWKDMEHKSTIRHKYCLIFHSFISKNWF